MVYEALSNVIYENEAIHLAGAYGFRIPTSNLVIHEHILALLMISKFDSALDLIDAADEDDFILLLLQAEIYILLDQHNKAIQSLNKWVDIY